MCKSLMTLHILELIKNSLLEVEKRSERITEPNDFLISETVVILMDSICMKLSAIGESIKNLDKITNRELLSKYSEIPWKNVMGVRDFIVHHYFEVDADVIFEICYECKPDENLVADTLKVIEDYVVKYNKRHEDGIHYVADASDSIKKKKASRRTWTKVCSL